jgi:ribonucleoside-diphosphate reductase beta chain
VEYKEELHLVKPFKVFDASKSNLPTRVFGGEASGVRDWDNIKYPTMLEIKKSLWGEYWSEDEIKLGKDIEQYREKLNDRERYVFNILTGMLNELDSSASDFLFYLYSVITDPSIRSVVSLIDKFEILHNPSYQYLTSTMLNGEEKHQAFEEVKTIEPLLHRNEHLYDKIDKFINVIREHLITDSDVDDVFIQSAFEAILAYQCLEGLHFSAAFVYFHSLARSQRMQGSNQLVNLIKADEQQHSEFFGTFIRIIMGENPSINTEANMNYAVDFIKECVVREKVWARHIFKGIDLFTIKEYEDYIEYLANIIARNAGIREPFPNNTELKSRWIVTYGSKKKNANDADQIVTRQDFLQGNAINYAHEGGEDFDL